MPDFALRIGKIKRRPILVVKATPYRVIVVDRDRISDHACPSLPSERCLCFSQRRTRRMDADDDQPLVFIFLSPRADIRKLAPPVDTGISPEFDQDDFSVQFRGGFNGCELSHAVARARAVNSLPPPNHFFTEGKRRNVQPQPSWPQPRRKGGGLNQCLRTFIALHQVLPPTQRVPVWTRRWGEIPQPSDEYAWRAG